MNRLIRTLAALVVAFALATPASAQQGETLDRIAAVVGDSILLLSEVHEEMLQWVFENWKGRVGESSPFSTEVTEHQCWESSILERYGFQSTHTFYTRRFDLTRELVPTEALA